MPRFLLPAEWAPQSAVLLTWPRPEGDWGAYYSEVVDNFICLTAAIVRFEPVVISCHEPDALQTILTDAGIDMRRVRLAKVPSNDVWARDHGPITVLRGKETKLLDFRFNGWGGKYKADLDNQITRSLIQAGTLNAPIESLDWVLEGGAIDTDGQGVMLTTTDCLPLATRNPGKSLRDFEALFAEHLGIHTTHWLTRGHLQGDDTDGHVDTIARFCSPEGIVYQGCDDPEDAHYEELQALGRELATLRQSSGAPYQLHALPLPVAIYDEAGQRLPASYANFLIVNDAVLMPGYQDPADAQARDILGHCFPEREIVTVDCRALIRQYGSLHCVTMQLPAPLKV